MSLASRLSVVTIMVILVSFAVGCGGGGSTSGVTDAQTGSLTISITFPEHPAQASATDDSPADTINSYRVVVAHPDSGTRISDIVFSRADAEATTETFSSVPAGVIDIDTYSYPTTDGSGPPRVQASAQTEVRPSQTSRVTISAADGNISIAGTGTLVVTLR